MRFLTFFTASVAFSVAACSAEPAPSTNANDIVDVEPCPPLPDALVPPGGTLTRPSGSVLRLELFYQAGEMAIDIARGVDMVLPGGGDVHFEPGVNAGYWYELQNAYGEALYTRSFQDPSMIEAPLPDGTFTQVPLPRCNLATILADVPNRPDAVVIVFYGSPHGTLGAARELTRFTLR